jgi:ribosomal protein S27AE
VAYEETAWRTDEPCPMCQTGLVLVDTGNPVLRAECRLCGYAGPFDTADLPDGEW